MNSASILLKCNLLHEKVRVTLLPKSTRHVPEDLEQLTTPTWDRYLRESAAVGRRVWDGELYRLENVRHGRNNDSVELELSTIPTREAIVFRLIDGREKYTELSWSKNMFIGALVETADNKCIFGVPSGKTTNSRSCDLIGGVLSAHEQILTSGEDLFTLWERELNEELNITASHIDMLTMKGLLLTRVSSVGVILHARLNLSSAEVQECFKKKNDEELRDIRVITKDELSDFLAHAPSYLPLLSELMIEV